MVRSSRLVLSDPLARSSAYVSVTHFGSLIPNGSLANFGSLNRPDSVVHGGSLTCHGSLSNRGSLLAFESISANGSLFESGSLTGLRLAPLM